MKITTMKITTKRFEVPDTRHWFLLRSVDGRSPTLTTGFHLTIAGEIIDLASPIDYREYHTAMSGLERLIAGYTDAGGKITPAFLAGLSRAIRYIEVMGGVDEQH